MRLDAVVDISEDSNISLTVFPDTRERLPVSRISQNPCFRVERRLLVGRLEELGYRVQPGGVECKEWSSGVVHEVDVLLFVEDALPPPLESGVEKGKVEHLPIPGHPNIEPLPKISCRHGHLAVIGQPSPNEPWTPEMCCNLSTVVIKGTGTQELAEIPLEIRRFEVDKRDARSCHPLTGASEESLGATTGASASW